MKFTAYGKIVLSKKSSSVGHFCLSILLLSLFVIEPVSVLSAIDTSPKKALTNDQQIRQILSRLTFGARPDDFERIKQIGIKAYIAEQLNYESIDDSALDKRLEKLPTLMLTTPTLAEQYNPPKPKPTPEPSPTATPTASPTAAPTPSPTPAESPTPPVNAPTPKPTPTPKNPQMVITELQRAKVLRAVYSDRQLYEVMVDFWENHFSIYAQKDATRWMLTGFDRDAIRPFALGKFRDLLGATAQNPAMLFYLDNWQSSIVRKYPATKEKPARQIGGLNENYARELMELHTMGVGGGYTQKDVQEVARCLTGWTIRKPNEEGTFIFNPAMHDNGEKLVLGQKIPAGGGIGDVEKVLDILAKHPSTAKFIATKLARRFLGDDPPAAVVNRAAQVFLKTDGSIGKTLQSIITSTAFLSPKAYQAKIKSPFEFVAAALRITGAETDANRPVLDWITRIGQPLFGHITPDGYPEYSGEWLSNSSLLNRFNFANALATNKIKGTTVDQTKILKDTDLNDPTAVVARLSDLILLNEVSPRTKEALDKIANESAEKFKMKDAQAIAAAPKNPPPIPPKTILAKPETPPKPVKPAVSKPPDYIAELLTLTLGAPEFQRK